MNLIRNIVQGIRLVPFDGSGRHQATALMKLSDISGDRHPSFQLLTGDDCSPSLLPGPVRMVGADPTSLPWRPATEKGSVLNGK